MAVSLVGFGTVGGPRVKEVLGSLSRAELDRGPGKIAREGGSVGLGNISRDHVVCGLGNVDRPRVKAGLGTIYRAGWGCGSWKMAR
jgi:hypothetical protein